uniref:DNA polymerase n=1 Tax=Simian cytomegalovirus (strain Colburn) TaxID=50292 RepID=G9M071_SCMVC|nr:DNA polymerase catalytic subunit [Cercopithecine betaherpesvirus 5]
MFFNPYLAGARKPPACVAKRPAQKTFLELVPRGAMYDGQSGLIKHKTGRVPIMFYRDIKHVLDNDMAWPCPLPPSPPPIESIAGRVFGPLKFHTYDQVDGVLTYDTSEGLSPRYRHHITPSGNVLRFFGATEQGHSICVNVFGQRSYFYCEYQDGELLRDLLASASELVAEPRMSYALTIVQATKTSIYGYGTRPVPNLYQVSMSNWSMAKKIGEYLLEQGVPVYEIRVDPLTRLVIDKKMTTFGWCCVNRYEWRHKNKSSTCDFEIDCDVADLMAIADDTSWPVYRCLSFDIECMSASGGFPVAEQVDDIIIQISCVCYETGGTGREVSTVFGTSGMHLFTIGRGGGVGTADVYEFPSEYEMLLGFLIFFKRYAPCFVTGYNINAFDFKYILTRLETVYKMSVGPFSKLPSHGRFYTYTPPKRHYAMTTATKVFISGCVVIDMYPVCMAKTNSPNYKLNTMAELYLNQQKEDLSYKEIPVRFIAGSEGRADVGKYCMQDALLVRDLFNIINFHYEAGAIARLAKIPMRRVVFDGQQIRIYTSLLDECACRDFILPNHKGADASAENPEVSYQGATVFEPQIGYYSDPVVVFDFASLYPSIIMAHNLCYSTLIMPDGECPPDTQVFTVELENGVTHRFAKNTARLSVLSELLTKWVSQRRAVRETMRGCQDPVKRMLLDKEQLALKVTCNAFYGFTGVVNGMMPCLPIAASITRIGRDMLTRTSTFVEENFTEPCFLHNFFNREDYSGDPVEVKVIYGDTDSVFVCYRGITATALINRGPSLAAYVTQCLFVDPIKLEFEKVFVSLMMICKKRYIGKVSGESELSMKGVDLVRKTSCEFVKNVTRDIIQLLFDDPEVSRAAVQLSRLTFDELKAQGVPLGFWRVIQRLCKARDDLYTSRARVEELVLSSVLSKDVSLYKQANLPHIAVIKRLAARSEELPTVGDRVFYVLTYPGDGRTTGVCNYEIAEDPAYVREHGVPIHAEKYFDQVIKAVTNVLSPVFPPETLKKDKFLIGVLPRRVYLESAFLPYSVKANEHC